MIELTQDYRRVTRFYKDPCISIKVGYLMEVKDGEDVGVWVTHKHKDGCKVHAAMGPRCRGRAAIDSAKDLFRWLFDVAGVSAVYAKIERTKRAACLVAVSAGMIQTGADNNNRFFEVTKWPTV